MTIKKNTLTLRDILVVNMTHSSNSPTNSNDDEIDIVDLIGALWDGKWILASITILGTLVGALYSLSATKASTGTLTVGLSDQLVEQLSELSVHLEGLENTGISASTLTQQAAEFARISKWGDEFFAPTIDVKVDGTTATLTFKGTVDSVAELPSYFEAVQSETNKKIVEVLTNDLNKLVVQVEKNWAHSIEQKEQSLKELIRAKNLEKQLRLKFLEEQLEIAQAIGQTKSIFQSTEQGIASSTSIPNLPYYHFGSIAIALEIEQIQNTKLDDKRYQDIVNAKHDIEKLKQERQFEFSSANAEKFVVQLSAIELSNFGQLEIETTSNGGGSKTIILAFLASGFLSVVVLVVLRSLQTYWKRQTID